MKLSPPPLPGRAFCVLLIAVSAAAPAWGFDYFEHRYLGNTAYRNALGELRDPGLSEALARAAGESLGFGRKPAGPSDLADRLLERLQLQFGDLSALAGDFTEDERDLKKLIGEMLKREKGSRARALIVDTRRQWFSACKWLYRSRGESRDPGPAWEDCFRSIAGDGDLGRPPKREFGSSGYQASREELAEHEMVPRYISLASQNKAHFPRHSWKSYSDHHSEALRFASCYARKVPCAGAPLSGEALLVEAILNEAFAQHYLHDSFAAGHIGTGYGECRLGFFCTPTKRRLKQTHDFLNELGLEVRISPSPSDPRRLGEDAAAKLRTGWTAFGDDHLFIREADFHRAVVVLTATESIKEVFEHAREGQAPAPCRMCTSTVFPIPGNLSTESLAALSATDLSAATYPAGDLVRFDNSVNQAFLAEKRSLDPRIPGIPVEGWKLGLGSSRQSLGGNLRTGPLETGGLLRLDYLRSGDPNWPNSYGFEYWGLPNFRSSYLFTVGYSWPRDLSPFSLAIRGKIGWRVEDTFTRNNPTDQRIGGLEIVFPAFELTYEVYPPVALFAQVNAAALFLRHGTRVTELINHKEFSSAIGLRFDLSGI